MLLHFEFSADGSTFAFPLALRALHERLRTLQTHKDRRWGIETALDVIILCFSYNNKFAGWYYYSFQPDKM